MAITTVSDLNSLFNTIYEAALFHAREVNMMTPLVRNYNATGWMSRQVGIRPLLTAQVVADGVDYANAVEFGKSLKATLTPKEIMTQVILTDREIQTDPDSAAGDAAREMGAAIATKIDKDLLALFDSFTTDKGPGAGVSASISSMAAAISVLRNNLAPSPIYIVLHPYQWHSIWVALGQPASTQAFLGDIANQALRDFFVGTWLQATWFVNANITVDGSDDAVGGVFNTNALAFDSRKAPMLERQRDASFRAWELNMSAGYAVGVLRDEFGVGYTSDASEPS